MPVDPYRNVTKAVDRLTTQVRRVAEAMVAPVVEDTDARQTTGDDARGSPPMTPSSRTSAVSPPTSCRPPSSSGTR